SALNVDFDLKIDLIVSGPEIGDIRFLEALLIDDSIPFPNNESSGSDFDNPSVPRPPPKPPDAKFNFEPYSGEVISVVMNDKDELECFNPGG
nr:hypothetical protein [Tanacetum cinerariifolium]